MRSELPAPEYSLATDICDELAGNTKVLDSIWICFEKSNSGADYLKVLDEKMKQLESVKKKIEKANQNLQKTKEM